MLNIIKEAVETATGLDITKKTRERDYVLARCLYYHFARNETGLSLNSIGKSMNLDHATVIHSLNKFDEYYKYDIFFKKNYHKLVILLKPDDKDTEHMNPAEIIDYLKIRIIEQNKENIKLKLELSTSLEDKPRLEKLLQGIPEERIQFFINNQMRSFITMERANLKKQLFYEQANKSIRHTKQTAIQADFEETGKRVRKQTLKFTLPS